MVLPVSSIRPDSLTGHLTQVVPEGLEDLELVGPEAGLDPRVTVEEAFSGGQQAFLQGGIGRGARHRELPA
jgi:hypothetical protein